MFVQVSVPVQRPPPLPPKVITTNTPVSNAAQLAPCCALRRRCLRSWQRTLREQGSLIRARHCELCKQPYFWDPASRKKLPLSLKLQLAADRAGQLVLQAAGCRSFSHLLLRAWKAYLWGSSLAWSCRCERMECNVAR